MKRSIFILVFLALAVTCAFAQNFQLGVSSGFLFDSNFVNSEKMETFFVKQYSFLGSYISVDATYAELDFDLTLGSVSDLRFQLYEPSGSGSEMRFGINLLGKYPFDLKVLKIFPLIGASYNIVVFSAYPDGKSLDNPRNENQFGLLGGIGTDFRFADGTQLYRIEILAHLLFPSIYTMNTVKNNYSYFDGGIKEFNTARPDMGLRIKIGLADLFWQTKGGQK